MFNDFLKTLAFVVSYIVAISISFYFATIFDNRDFTQLIIFSPIILIHLLFGFYAEKFTAVISYSLCGSVVLISMAKIEKFLNPVEIQEHPGLLEVSFSLPTFYNLIVIFISFFVSFVPLLIGWILGIIKGKIFIKNVILK
jgi:hypothetical protein